MSKCKRIKLFESPQYWLWGGGGGGATAPFIFNLGTR